jgi:hypothetical protein
VPAERDGADNGEQRQEIAKDADKLRQQSVRNGLYFKIVFAVKAVGAVAGEVMGSVVLKGKLIKRRSFTLLPA